MKVVVGLGNPGDDYADTRHNVGWLVVDHLAGHWAAEKWRRDGNAMVAAARLGTTAVRLVKPQTYMNLSGAALRPYLRRLTWSPSADLLVIADEVALPLGVMRIRASGSAGGHNGLKSIEQSLGSREYARLRIGIQAPADRAERGLTDHVLGRLERAERAEIERLFPRYAEAVTTWVREGIELAMNQFNRPE